MQITNSPNGASKYVRLERAKKHWGKSKRDWTSLHEYKLRDFKPLVPHGSPLGHISQPDDKDHYNRFIHSIEKED